MTYTEIDKVHSKVGILTNAEAQNFYGVNLAKGNVFSLQRELVPFEDEKDYSVSFLEDTTEEKLDVVLVNTYLSRKQLVIVGELI